jgi:tetratricopeptide (TPR) repeat protein
MGSIRVPEVLGQSVGSHRGTQHANSRQCVLGIPILALALSLGCASRPVTKSSPSAAGQTMNAAQAQTGAPSQAANQQAGQALSFATHPERFVKMPTYDRAFRLTNPKTAYEHFDVAVNLDNQKQPAKAAIEYEKALALRPLWAIAHFRLARDYARIGRTNDAITNWTKAIQDSPDMLIAYEQLAAAYISQGKIQKAIDVYFGLMRYPAAEMGARFQVALWYEELGKRDEAKQNFRRYRELALQHGPEEKMSERFQVAERELQKLNRQG